MSTGFSRTWSIRALAVVLLGAIVAGCLDRTVTGPEHANGVDFAARLVVLDGNSQSGAVNSALPTPIKLRVTDVNGSPVAGASVAFSLRQGGGSLNPFSATSATDGTVSTTWTLGTALGANKVVAILTGAFVVDSVTLTATGTNGPAAKLAIDAGDSQHAAIGTVLPAAISTLVTDNFGNPVPGAEVTYRVTGGGGRIDLVRTTSDASGKISANWTLGTTAGQQTATASLASGASITYRAVADAGLPVQIIQESGSGQTGTVGRALTSPVSVRVVDAYGNNVRGVSVSWIAEDGSISANSATTDTLGRSQGRWVLGTRAGTQNASVSVSGLTAVSVVAIAQSAVPFQVTLETGDKQTQTVRQTLALPLVAKITDQYGNGVTGTPVTWNAASGGGSLLATLATSDNTGRSTAIWTLGASAGSQLATLAVTGLPLTVYSATAIAASGDSVVIEAGNNQSGTVSTALGTPLVIRVRDTSGNPVVGTSVIFAVASGGGTMTPTIVNTDANGRATSAWTLGSFAGPQTVTATVGAKSVTFTATGAAVGGGGGGGGGTLTPAQIVLVSGNGQNGSVGQTLGSPIVVQIIDASGIPVTGVNVTWTLAAGNSGGFASPTVSRTDGSGNANLLWTLGSKVGLQQVTASVTGVTSVTLQATALIGSSGALLIDNGDGQGGATGAALATYLRVLVVDQSGTPVVGARVVWSTATGNGTLSKASGLTNAAGLDSASWTLGAALATQTATATVAGLAAVTFRATGSSSGGVPTTLRVVSGDGQVGRSATQLTSPLVVEVRDASGTPLSGVSVLFTQGATNTDGYVSPSPTTTDASGQVSVRWTLGSNLTNAARANSVTATLPAFPAVTGVSFTATARPQYRMRYVRGTSSNAHCLAGLGVASCPTGLQVDTTGATLRPQFAGDTRTDTLVVQVYDPTDSTGVQGVSVTWAGQAGDVVDGRAVNASVTTDNFGFAKNVWLLRNNLGIAISPSGVAKRMIAASAGVGEVEFQARVFPGNLLNLSVTAVATNLYTDSSNVITIKATDATGYPIAGASVTFAVSAGSASPLATTTNGDGLASIAWKFGAVSGAQTLSVSVTTTTTGPYAVVITKTGIIPYGVNP